MKIKLAPFAVICSLLLTHVSCNQPAAEKEKKDDTAAITSYTYTVSVESYTNTHAPALQSFVHGVHENEVLLFAGRTNQSNDEGGLHDLNGDYAGTSFIPKSYNTNIYVYNLENQSVHALTYEVLLSYLVDNYCPSIDTEANVVADCKTFLTNHLSSLFKATNPISTQDGTTLYVLGGYGPIPGDVGTYLTYNQIATINIPVMIQLIKEGPSALKAADWQNLIQLGKDETNTLVSTGAEMYKIGNTIYLAGGHNFGTNQKYLDAVYPFTITSDVAPYKLNVTASNPISDVNDPKAEESDNTSKFRRRDGPVTAALFENAAGELTEGLAFYAGVFMPGPDSDLKAWSTAIYVHPELAESKYTIDNAYQQTQSIYACGDFTAYESTNSTVHTFLLGGIGNDTLHPMTGYSDSLKKMPFGFTNNGAHIKYDLKTRTSSKPEVLVDVFPAGQKKFYGAESTLIPSTSSDIHYVKAGGNQTEVIDLDNSVYTNDELVVGYVYGGIEAFQLNPGTYGSGKSAASNKIWKVTLKRTVNQ